MCGAFLYRHGTASSTFLTRSNSIARAARIPYRAAVAIISIQDLSGSKGTLLGIDPGGARFGIAASDDSRLIASSVITLKKNKFAQLAADIFAHYDERRCTGIVIGLAVNMDGSDGPRTQSARSFAANLLAVRDVPIVFWDERLSTQAVTRTLLEADVSRARRKEKVDALAATYILQGLLDRLRAENTIA